MKEGNMLVDGCKGGEERYKAITSEQGSQRYLGKKHNFTTLKRRRNRRKRRRKGRIYWFSVKENNDSFNNKTAANSNGDDMKIMT